MPRLTLVLLLLCFALATASGQGRVADSLHQRLAAAPPDTSRVRLLAALSQRLSAQDAAQAQAYGQQALALARQLHDRPGEMASLGALARVAFYLRQDLLASTRYYQQLLRLAEQPPRSEYQVMQAQLGLGRVAVHQQDYAEAQRYFRLVLGRLEQAPPAQRLNELCGVQLHLASLYLNWLHDEAHPPDSVAGLQARYARLALASARQLGQPSNLAPALGNMGMAYQRAGRYDSALLVQAEARQLYQRQHDLPGATLTQQTMGEVRLAQHRWAEAAALLRPTIAQAHTLRSPNLQAQGMRLLAEALSHLGQLPEAYQLVRDQQVLSDSLNSTERRAALARLQVQFDTERQRHQVQTLTQRTALQQQRLLLALLLLAAVGLGLVGAALLARRLRRSQRLLAAQNQELLSTRAEQDRLYALVAHDLRSPVEAFAGLAGLLSHYVERQDTVRLASLGSRVQQTAESLRHLLNNLLSWALSQRGELLPHPEALPVAALLAEVVALYQPNAEAQAVALHLAPGPACHVWADPHMTRTILRNLVSNALRATPAGGSIGLAAVAEGPAVALRVQDTGEGMSETYLQQLLRQGPRVGTARGTTGLGLRLSQSFALAQGGQLTLDSRLGHGTTAVLRLPAAPPAP